MTSIMTICLYCKNRMDDWKCKAYPKGIPDEIVFMDKDHTKNIDGDNGIKFEPEDEQGKKYAEEIVGHTI